MKHTPTRRRSSVRLAALGLLLGLLGAPLEASQQGTPFSQQAPIEITIKMAAADWQKLRISHRNFVRRDISEKPYPYYRADVVIDDTEYKSVGVRKKGFFGSVVSTRPSLKIRFDKWVDDQNLNGLTRLTLNNNVQDSSQVSQHLAYTLFRRAGVPAPRSGFAVVHVNGESLGVYTNVESIRRPFLRRAFGDDGKGALYEGYASDFIDGPRGITRIASKRGRPDSKRQPLQQLRDLLHPADISVSEVAKHVDLDSFVTFWVAEVLMGHWDSYSGNGNNYYLYRDRKSKRLHFIPWGADSIALDPGPFIRHEVPKSVKAAGRLCHRLWRVPAIQQRYRDEMRRQLREVFKERELLAEIDRVEKMLVEHVTVDPASFKKGLATMREFIRSRRVAIEHELDGAAPVWPDVTDPRQARIRPTLEIEGAFKTTMFEENPSNPFRAGQASVTITVDGETQKPFPRIGAYALPEHMDFVRPGYPIVRIIAIHPTTQQPWLLQFTIDPVRLPLERPTLPVDHFGVWAMLLDGDRRDPKAKGRLFGIRGELRLDRFNGKVGDAVEGSFKITTKPKRDDR